MINLRRRYPTVSLVLVATLSACGGDSAPVATPVSAGQVSAGQVASITLNDADVEFAQGMIAHHEQAIEMAEIALDPNIGAGPEVLDLATRIKGAQDPEVELMTGWLTAAGASMTMDTDGGHEMSSMDGMMSADQMDAMAAMTGAEFDQTWLEMMIEHHEGAVSQSQTVKTDGSNTDVLALADAIITAQQAEIAEMQALLKG